MKSKQLLSSLVNNVINNLFLPTFEPGTISVYIHWPFCLKKCPYCDFNSYVSKSVNHNDWLQGYKNSILGQQKFLDNKIVKSIFFGGGTPSLMEPYIVNELINHFKEHNHSLNPNLSKDNQYGIKEITLESNPSTFEINRFTDFKQAGITRLSTGIQSFSNSSLKFLGRNHNALEAIKALEASNNIFARTSFDLIIGLPGQALNDWQNELDFALKFFKEHISIYQLTIEKGTPFSANKVPEADEEIAAQLYLHTIETLRAKNIHQYEISNFAITNGEGIHNLNYWKGGEYLGIGPNAHGRVFYNNAWFATREIKNPNKWLDCALANNTNLLQNPLFEEYTQLSLEERFEEIVLTHLRVSQDIPEFIINNLNPEKIQLLKEQNLLIWSQNKLYISDYGRMCLNYITSYLLT
ncbi:coproporphyrinogen-III oxidase-like radical SAM protein [Candidatus Hepatincolaceae symbiont of Richtersius coronifer]